MSKGKNSDGYMSLQNSDLMSVIIAFKNSILPSMNFSFKGADASSYWKCFAVHHADTFQTETVAPGMIIGLKNVAYPRAAALHGKYYIHLFTHRLKCELQQDAHWFRLSSLGVYTCCFKPGLWVYFYSVCVLVLMWRNYLVSCTTCNYSDVWCPFWGQRALLHRQQFNSSSKVKQAADFND